MDEQSFKKMIEYKAVVFLGHMNDNSNFTFPVTSSHDGIIAGWPRVSWSWGWCRGTGWGCGAPTHTSGNMLTSLQYSTVQLVRTGVNPIPRYTTQFAAAKAGLVLVNINPAYQTAELAYCLNKVTAVT